MDNNEIQLLGGPCGQHGPYTFYKAFRYTKNGVKRVMTLSEFFFVKLWIDSDLVCIGELQLLWVDKNSEQVLASLRLYFLPENTPEGRMDHGEDEVLAISEKVVLRVEDLITWITIDAEWTWGKLGTCEEDINEPSSDQNIKNSSSASLTENSLDFEDVLKEKNYLNITNGCGPSVIILSYPRYCRYRAMMKRLEGIENIYLKYEIVKALGGFPVTSRNTRILFCRDTFDYPDLEGHELLCNHLAPKLKGRPRGKRKKRSLSPGSESNESESSITNVFNSAKTKITTEGGRNGLRCDSTTSPRRSSRTIESNESKVFLKKLFTFMKASHTPIGRIPSLGYKEIDLYAFFTKVQKLGGYDSVTSNRLWKSIFDDLSGNHNSTSAATVIRRHYERLLLAYERHIKGEEYKPLPVSERRRLKSKTNSISDAETSEGTSHSGNSTPIPQLVPISNTPSTPPTPTENKDFAEQAFKMEVKTSSLRSIRVKPERLRDPNQKDKIMILDKIVNVNSENTNQIKTEPKELDEIDNKVSITGTISNSHNKNSFPEKTCEPVTTAVAPIVLQKTSLNKSMSPAEGKENISLANADETESANVKKCKDDLVEVPYETKSSDVIDTDAGSCNVNLPSKSCDDAKKRKLDILKEGGLEVTPISSLTTPPLTKDIRPSVIQATSTQQMHKVTVTSDKLHMPPPSFNVIPSKKNVTNSTSSHCTTTSHNNKRSSSFIFVNGHTPPKVVQSKSIYSYSERKVYGNPKDCFMSPISLTVHSPKILNSNVKQSDILDLTVSSPQKSVVGIMQVPNVSTFNFKENHRMKNFNKNTSAVMPLLEGRKLGSNLEITLVNTNNNNNNRLYYPHNQNNHIKSNMYHKTSQVTQKRIVSENHSTSTKFPKIEESETSTKLIDNTSTRESIKFQNNSLEITTPKLYSDNNSPQKQDNQTRSSPSNSTNQKHNSANQAVPAYSSYLPQIPNVKPYLPLLDPFYYSALQNLYSHNPTSSVPGGLYPIPTPEQLQFYNDLLTRSATNRYPFPVSPENMSSETNNINNQ